MRAAESGLYPTVQHALRDLYDSASRAKRSKIGSFAKLYQALGDALHFPTALGERQGLQLAKALESDPALAKRLKAELGKTRPEDSPSEQALLASVFRGETGAPAGAAKRDPATDDTTVSGAVRLVRKGPARLVLEGEGVDPAFEAELLAWLKGRDR